MKSPTKLTAVALAVLTLTLNVQAIAADAQANPADAPVAAPPATPAAAAKDTVAADIQQVVVTGVTSGGAVRNLGSSFSIAAPSVAQLLNGMPTIRVDVMISPPVD